MKPLWLSWPTLRKQIAQTDNLLLLLDYDGTLTPIYEHPSKAHLPSPAARILQELTRQPGIWIALVSGRSLRDLTKMVGLRQLCYVGNHGLEVKGPKLRYVNPVAQRSRRILNRIAKELTAVLKPIQGAWVENKSLTLSVHSREVRPEEKVLVKNGFYEVVRSYQEKGQVRVTTGKEVFEVRPPVRWTKGTVVNWFLARHRALGSDKGILPLYIGDDQTDEDAFETLKGRGITIAVGASNPLSLAEYSVRSPEEVQRLLRMILQLRTKSPSPAPR